LTGHQKHPKKFHAAVASSVLDHLGFDGSPRKGPILWFSLYPLLKAAEHTKARLKRCAFHYDHPDLLGICENLDAKGYGGESSQLPAMFQYALKGLGGRLRTVLSFGGAGLVFGVGWAW